MAVGVDGRWQLGIGDPTVMGWVTVCGYGATALLALRCARRASQPTEFGFWAIAAGALLLLGVNKQLDLQSLATQIGRDLALAQGWYGARRLVQAAFIGALVALGAAAGAWLLWLTRRMHVATQLGGAGLVLLVVFVVIRGVSFHHVDDILGSRIEGIRYNWLLELTPLALIAGAAWWRRRSTALHAKAGARRRRHRSG